MPRRATKTSYNGESGNPRGRGPKPGAPNAGPRTKSFKHFLASLRTSPATQNAIKQALSDPDSRGFNAALRVLSEYDTDKPAEKHTIVGPVQIKVSFSREGRRTTAS